MLNLKEVRKELHKIPELGFEEFKTQKYILNILNQFPELKIHRFDFPGILVEYAFGDEEYKLFRAEMDGLSVYEETNCGFESEHKGKMHACGHDIHMTVLIGFIEKVVRSGIKRNLLFLFQPAEEGKGGAERILQTGILEKFQISEAYALHVKGDIPVGSVSSRPGIFFANTQEVKVLFHGKSAHVAFPENGRNALAAGVMFYRLIHQELKKEVPGNKSIICEFGKMQAGTVMNAIAAECALEGTIRTFNDEDMYKVKNIIKNSAQVSSKEYDLKYEINYLCYYRNVKNDVKLFEKFKKCLAKTNVKFCEAERVFTGEDFGYFSYKYKGLLFWLGADQGENYDVHSTKFLPDERSIDVGVDVFWVILNS